MPQDTTVNNNARASKLIRTLEHMTRYIVRYSELCEFLHFIPLFCAFRLQQCFPLRCFFIREV